ncbi:MAG TPA: SLBB domain-containing protein [Bdellovibrionales bacterium]|nr:SLBB domain-containing protein [Bdellovibrionales bacterium]
MILLLCMISSTARAQLPGTFAGISSSGSEFFVGRIEGKPLITVHLISGVRFPGVYHVPIQTNLAQLFAFAGGTNDNADLGDILIRSQAANGTPTVREVDLKEIVEDNGLVPVLQERDTIVVDTKVDYIGRTAMYVGVIGGVLAVILSAIAIERSR